MRSEPLAGAAGPSPETDAPAAPTPGAARAGLISGSVGFLARAVGQLATLAVTIAATRTLSTASFGAFAIALAFTFLARNLLYVGPYEYQLKAAPAPRTPGSCLVANVIVAAVAMAGLGVMALVSPRLFGSDEVGWLLVRLLPSVLLVAGTAWAEAGMLRRGLVRRYYLVNVAADLAGAATAIACLFAGWGLAALVVQVYVRLGLMALLYLIERGGEGLPRPDAGEVRRVLGWSRTRYGASLLNFGSSYGADLVLGIVLSPAATGLYRAANRIVTALSDLFTQPLLKIAQTNVSAHHAAGEAPGARWLEMFAGVAAIGWAALAALAVNAGAVVPFVLGAQWQAAAPLVGIFCIARGLTFLDSVSTPVLVAGDQQRFMLPVQVAVAVLALGGGAALASQGPLAVAAAVAAIAAGMSLVYLRRALRITAAPAPAVWAALRVAAAPAAAVLAVAALADLVSLSPLSRLAATAAGAVAGLILMRRPLARALAALGAPRPAPRPAPAVAG